MEMTLDRKSFEMNTESEAFKKETEEAIKEYEKNTTKEQEFLEEIQAMANSTEDKFAEGIFELGQISLNPDKWREKEIKVGECNILKAKVQLLNEVSDLFTSIFNSRT